MVRGSVSTAGATVAKVLCRISLPIIPAFVVSAMAVTLPATSFAEGLNAAQDAHRAVATSQTTPAPAAAGWECLTMQPVLALNGRLTHTAARFATGGRLTILAIGSSTTAGVGTSSPAAAYPAQLVGRLEEKLPLVDIDMHVSGIGGETAVQTLARLEKQVAELKPDLVIWQVGTNDALTSVGEDVFRNLVERGIAAATAADADLILLDQQFFPTISDKQRYERFVNLVTEVGLKTKTCVFSRYALMKGWGDQSAVALQAMLSSDGFHMSDRGHACMARLLGREILRAAREGDKPVALAGPTQASDKTAIAAPGF
ncbi:MULTISPECIES: SGNH/GDSL hydrolase family protein [unclassified Chelatococcus]|jgi:lysophospholipase L1-like esterase|uniref:SGNH/GDSL hydrolase family protein n=1 Tax=unclassified Chelatococcus TaxID=2638111 RepID=UPI001BD02DFA|nr:MULTISPECIES: SGNH/GDSL hydrolase family protein [unclassified Chelatococcus]CAH1666317.1 Lysophospholipase L1-like esterase [Hyphomicrobiales bacterium]MBS7737841.1 SGNH/GDSL hydrolase family protein [Chelatococcus sp. HY11]MBX3546711.1 SGNH/GDSL hydrolase family protein [Chelatococcus sp.]MCO5079295.1 SGNH/GDSL hydrolase family protein [Chelatococcus sp.]CAH1680692.1 Lysophospholipase L1-like esterase [Hyphomicrobiales bacterium]